jgi:hypothetical protein
VLAQGWNLLVLPDLTISELAGHLSCVQAVYRYTEPNWESWIRGAPAAIQELSAVGGGATYWVLASGGCAHDFP